MVSFTKQPARWPAIRLAGIALVLVVTAISVTLPAWFPWLLRPVLRAQGLRY